MPNDREGKRYLITHGAREYGANPRHTDEGIAQLRAIDLPEGITGAVVGTGERFEDVYHRVWVDDLPTEYSPFCGSADGLQENGDIILADETIVAPQFYMGLIRATEKGIFDPWAFISSYPAGTVFCAGGELLRALGLGAINKKAGLYELDPQTKTGRCLN